MPTVHGHVEAKRDVPEYAACVACHRTCRPRGEDQACMALCEECFESAKYPREPVIRVHVRPRTEKSKSDLPL